MIDELKRPRLNESAIVNLQKSNEIGSHWVAYCCKSGKVLYFDSYALPPPVEIVQYFSGTPILYNSITYQTFDSFICGHLCLKFLVKVCGIKCHQPLH